MEPDSGDIVGVLLAGGASRRFGADKASARLGGVPLIERVAARARPQVHRLVVSGQAELGLPVIADNMPGAGPLAAVSVCLSWAAQHGYAFVATFPCDAPFFPADLVPRLKAAMAGADCAMARCRGQGHYAFGLWHTALAGTISAALAKGLRSFREIEHVVSRVYADFDEGEGPGNDPFFNINRPEDLAAAEAWLARSK